MLFLNGSDIMKAVSLEDVMQAVSDAYMLFDKGTCCTPNRAFYAHEGNSLIYMPCFSPDALITKILSFFPENRKKGKPTLDGVVLWTDPDSGEILSILDAKKITALRTGAAGGLAVKYLSAPDSRTLGVVGAGTEGGEAELAVHPDTVGTYRVFVTVPASAAPAGTRPITFGIRDAGSENHAVHDAVFVGPAR